MITTITMPAIITNTPSRMARCFLSEDKKQLVYLFNVSRLNFSRIPSERKFLLKISIGYGVWVACIPNNTKKLRQFLFSQQQRQFICRILWLQKCWQIKHTKGEKKRQQYRNDGRKIFKKRKEKRKVCVWMNIRYISLYKSIRSDFNVSLTEIIVSFPFQIFNRADQHQTLDILTSYEQ